MTASVVKVTSLEASARAGMAHTAMVANVSIFFMIIFNDYNLYINLVNKKLGIVKQTSLLLRYEFIDQYFDIFLIHISKPLNIIHHLAFLDFFIVMR